MIHGLLKKKFNQVGGKVRLSLKKYSMITQLFIVLYVLYIMYSIILD